MASGTSGGLAEERWEPTSLGRVCAPRRDPVEPALSDGARYVGLEHLDGGVTRITRWSADEGLRSTKHRFFAGDVLYGKLRPNLEKAALAEWEGICSTELLVLSALREVCSPAYLSFLLHRPDFVAHAVSSIGGVNLPRTSWSAVSQFAFLRPPVVEQSAISSVLSRIQEAVETEAKRAKALRDLRAATMARLFLNGLHDEAPTDTEIGPLPRSWRVVMLNALCREPLGAIQTGPFGSQLHSSDYVEDGVPIVNPTHIVDGHVVQTHIPRVTDADAARLDRHRLQAGDILFSRRGDVGRHAYVGEREKGWLVGTGCLLVRPAPGAIDPKFLSYALDHAGVQGYLKTHAAGVIMPNINTKILSSVPIPFAPPPDQGPIAAALSCVDTAVETAGRRLALLSAIFSTGLQLLTTGILRVPRRWLEAPRD